ncbi:hypothetical protein OS493_021539 [Desmophyllum pertusum]|uniref:Uncharacterized protein n=1 Tax=Desmophyllum pertusum TaxID=174260 RepID=A0A9W9YMQ4_9CNID|nr:hypothetical protein OS493_021539 [Desmophyllum pertusum]
MTDPGQGTSDEIHQEAEGNAVKKKRTQSRRRVTLSIKRIREILDKGQGEGKKGRLGKEIEQLRKDYEIARELNGELYDLVEEDEHNTLDQWENDLTDDVFSIEEEVETSLIALQGNQVNPSGSVEDASHASNPSGSVEDASHASNASGSVEDASHASNASGSVEDASHASIASGSAGNTGQASGANVSASNQVQTSHSHDLPVNENHADNSSELTVGEGHASGHAGHASISHGEALGSEQTLQTSGQPSQAQQVALQLAPKPKLETQRSFDSWIDNLVEFQETVLPMSDAGNITIADALFKLEANKDIPAIQLPSFDGDALSYTDFIDQFKIHIHDKGHLKDDTRMVQLRMHVKGEAARVISGLGSNGIMYATALKSLKEQFGQSSVIARAVVNKLTMGDKISRNNRQALRDFSLDIINCLAVMHRLNYFARCQRQRQLEKNNNAPSRSSRRQMERCGREYKREWPGSHVAKH